VGPHPQMAVGRLRERNVEVLCEAALNAPAGAVGAPNPPPLPASSPSQPDFFILSQSASAPQIIEGSTE
jgi:hypothetical protein